MADDARDAFGEARYEEIVADTAYYIDKYCTGGTEEDFTAARLIIDSLYAAGLLRPLPPLSQPKTPAE